MLLIVVNHSIGFDICVFREDNRVEEQKKYLDQELEKVLEQRKRMEHLENVSFLRTVHSVVCFHCL